MSSKQQHLTMPSIQGALASGLPDTQQPPFLHSSSALSPLAADAGSHAQHRECKGKQSHALHTYLPDKTARHFCLLSADEWRCLGCEISLQIPLRAQLLAGSPQLQPPIATGAFWQGLPPHPRDKLSHSVPPSASAPVQRQHPFMGHCRIGSIALFTWDVQASNAKWCCLLLDFMVFPTLHSSFVHLLFQHQQTTKGNLRLH